MTGTIASPVAQWPETPSSGAAKALTRLVPWKQTDGFWILLPQGVTPPVGAVQGAWLKGLDGFVVPTLATMVGQRITKNASGFVFNYGQPQLFRFVVGDVLTTVRASTANYDGESTEPAFKYVVGDALTTTRGSTANYDGEV